MPGPVRIFVAGQELEGWTSLSLSRKKIDLTGAATIRVFMSYLPASAIAEQAVKSQELLIYIGGFLAFTGIIDRRRDKSTTKKVTSDQALRIGTTSYELTITARGKTKRLIDSSHLSQITRKDETTRNIIEDLIEPWALSLDWAADTLDSTLWRLRDGGHVFDEMQRLAEQDGLYIYETRDGRIRVTDDRSDFDTGEALALGTNILSFDVDQAEDWGRDGILVKGQDNRKGFWGDNAVLPFQKVLETTGFATGPRLSPINVQHYGQITEDRISRRAEYEYNRRRAQDLQVRIDVFHVQQTTGEPWDIGVRHRVIVPCANIDHILEVQEVAYTVTPPGILKTQLVFGRPPTLADGGATATGGDDFLAGVDGPGSYGGGGEDEGGSLVKDPCEGTYRSEFCRGMEEGADIVTDTFLSDAEVIETTPPLTLPA